MVRVRVYQYGVEGDRAKGILNSDIDRRYIGSGEDRHRMRIVVPSRMIQWECCWV